MKLILLMGISLIWGQASTQLFFRSWISFLGVICCAIGIFKTSAARLAVLKLSFSKITETIFYGLLLFIGFYILYPCLECGQSGPEILVYFISAMVRLFYVVPRISKEIDEVWSSVMGPD